MHSCKCRLLIPRPYKFWKLLFDFATGWFSKKRLYA